jgi:hypothetical protein
MSDIYTGPRTRIGLRAQPTVMTPRRGIDGGAMGKCWEQVRGGYAPWQLMWDLSASGYDMAATMSNTHWYSIVYDNSHAFGGGVIWTIQRWRWPSFSAREVVYTPPSFPDGGQTGFSFIWSNLTYAPDIMGGSLWWIRSGLDGGIVVEGAAIGGSTPMPITPTVIYEDASTPSFFQAGARIYIGLAATGLGDLVMLRFVRENPTVFSSALLDYSEILRVAPGGTATTVFSMRSSQYQRVFNENDITVDGQHGLWGSAWVYDRNVSAPLDATDEGPMIWRFDLTTNTFAWTGIAKRRWSGFPFFIGTDEGTLLYSDSTGTSTSPGSSQVYEVDAGFNHHRVPCLEFTPDGTDVGAAGPAGSGSFRGDGPVARAPNGTIAWFQRESQVWKSGASLGLARPPYGRDLGRTAQLAEGNEIRGGSSPATAGDLSGWAWAIVSADDDPTWWKLTAQYGMTATIDARDSATTRTVNVYSGTAAGLTPVATGQGLAVWNAVKGITYYIEVS